ncbi:hypothetical protein Tco_0830091 [Tanacetum coccineum]
MTIKAQQIELDNALVAPENHQVIGKCNMRINPGMKPKEPTYQVALDALTLTTCYHAFLITVEVPVIYMHQFWATVIKHKSSYQFKIDKKRFSVNVELFREILNICPKVPGKSFDEPPTEEEPLSFIRVEPPMSRKRQKKSNSAISFEESPSKKKSAKVKKVATTKPKPTKKKAPVKADRGKGLNVLSEVALSEAAQLKEATKQMRKSLGGDSGEEDEDDENDSEDKSDDGDDVDDDGNDGNDGNDDDDANDDDNQEGDDTNDDDKETNKEEKNIDDEEMMDDEEDDEVTKELYKDVNVNLENEDTEMTNADQGGLEQQNISQESGFEQVEEDAHVTLTPVLETQKTDEPVQSSSVSSEFTSKLLNLEIPSPADNEIASLIDTIACHAMAVPKITSVFTITIPPPPLFFNPLPQQATPTLTPTNSEATTSFPSLLDFSSIFKFNDRVTNLEKDLLEIKQVDQYAQALSSIPAIVDRYIDNKLGEAINKAIQAHNLDCRQEAQDEKNEYIGLVDTSMRTIIKEEKNVTESLEVVVLARSSSQPKSTYEAAASLSKFKLTKILLDKMEESKSHLKADYKKKLYDALVESYNTDKDLFNTYGEAFTLKRSQDDRDKDQDPSDGSDRGTK